MAELNANTERTEADRLFENAAQYAAKCRREDAAKVAALKTLFDKTPLEAAQCYAIRLRHLLGTFAGEDTLDEPLHRNEMLWLLHDLAELVETAVDLIPESPEAMPMRQCQKGEAA
jgi:hypothetical protein